MPKFIIACRHGDYAANSLTKFGQQQASKLAESIKNGLDSATSSALLLSSPTTRTVETAVIIGRTLGVQHQCVDLLERDYYRWGEKQMLAILELAEDHEIIIVITHYEAPAGIVDAFSQKHFGKKVVGEKEIRKGSGLCLCMESGEVLDIP